MFMFKQKRKGKLKQEQKRNNDKRAVIEILENVQSG
jgi:hypothetical protein